jgi:hypothetical protein
MYKYRNCGHGLSLIHHFSAILVEADNAYIIVIILLSFMKRKKGKFGFMRLPYRLCAGVSPVLNHMTDFYEIWCVYCSIGKASQCCSF